MFNYGGQFATFSGILKYSADMTLSLQTLPTHVAKNAKFERQGDLIFGVICCCLCGGYIFKFSPRKGIESVNFNLYWRLNSIANWLNRQNAL